MSEFTPKQEAAWVEVLADLAKRGIRAKCEAKASEVTR